jgi:hypothetical protein
MRPAIARGSRCMVERLAVGATADPEQGMLGKILPAAQLKELAKKLER